MPPIKYLGMKCCLGYYLCGIAARCPMRAAMIAVMSFTYMGQRNSSLKNMVGVLMHPDRTRLMNCQHQQPFSEQRS